MLAIVPRGAVTSTARNVPSLFGTSAGRRERMAVNEVAWVTDRVALIAPLTCGELPAQSKAMRSPRLRTVTKSRMGLPKSTPSSSIQSSNSYSPSRSSASAARVMRSV